MPVLMNAFGSMERLALAFGVNDIEEIPNELREILRLPYISLQNKMDLIHIIPTAKRAINFPKYVKKHLAKKQLSQIILLQINSLF